VWGAVGGGGVYCIPVAAVKHVQYLHRHCLAELRLLTRTWQSVGKHLGDVVSASNESGMDVDVLSANIYGISTYLVFIKSAVTKIWAPVSYHIICQRAMIFQCKDSIQ